ncbi:MAG: hypothetical protein Q9180_008246 [Flavoplaca navasiana]
MEVLTQQAPEQREKTVRIGFFPFLSLPLELRRHIYSELLIPSIPSTGLVVKPRILWHDRHGLQKHIPVYPQILQASKQTNAEATPILYENNTFKINISSPVTQQCTGGMYPDGYESPQYLFRSDVPQRYFDGPGDIYPHCLQRISNAEIRLSTEAIWAKSAGGPFFSHIGDLLVEVLKVLAHDDANQLRKEPKRLLLTIHKDGYNEDGLDLFPKWSKHGRMHDANFAAKKAMAEQLPPLLEAVAMVRKVEIVEVASFTNVGFQATEQSTNVRTRDVDLKSFRHL